MVSFYPAFVSDHPKSVDTKSIADHIEYISDRIGKHQWVCAILVRIMLTSQRRNRFRL